jgi:hypothetical protein
MTRRLFRLSITNLQGRYLTEQADSRVEIKEDNGTSNITTADADGLVLSMTTTIGLAFGSRIIVPGYGFVLNDSMDDFSIAGRPNGTGYEPSPPNYGMSFGSLADSSRWREKAAELQLSIHCRARRRGCSGRRCGGR